MDIAMLKWDVIGVGGGWFVPAALYMKRVGLFVEDDFEMVHKCGNFPSYLV